MTTTRIPVGDLSYGVLDEGSRTIDWQEAAGEDGDGYDFWEAFNYTYQAEDGVEHELVLVANRSSVVAVFTADGTRIDPSDPDDYLSQAQACGKCGKPVLSDTGSWIDETGGDGCSGPPLESDDEGVHEVTGRLDLTDFDHLEAVEPYQYGAEGPMMNYWYSLGDVRSGYGAAQIGGWNHTADEIDTAYKLRHVSLCLVEVDETFGLALTGGGMDLTWQIVEAYTLLGYLPPAKFCRPPGFKTTDEDYLVAAMHRTLTALVERYQRDADYLVQQYPALSNASDTTTQEDNQ